jgi:hypothetical protein
MFGKFLRPGRRRSSTLISPRRTATRKAFCTVVRPTPARAAMAVDWEVAFPLGADLAGDDRQGCTLSFGELAARSV